ncbi:MAG: type 4a pilus biogenesis protein PilO [Acidimicrobiales bacterium]
MKSMRIGSLRLSITPRTALVALGVVVVVVVWILAFYLPQTHKLAALGTQRATLQSTVAADEAHLERAKSEDHHIGRIRAMYDELDGYVPASADLYTYIRTLSTAAKSAGVTITSLSPNAPVATGTTYSGVPITASVKGTYDQLLAFVTRLYDLPRLTDVNQLSITGGGLGTDRGTLLSATLQLAIFTSQRPTEG